MPDMEFSRPQHQSQIGILLIFATNVYQIIRSLWVLGVALIVSDIDREMLCYAGMGFIAALVLALIYSVLSFRNFRFHVDWEKEEFILQKGVMSSEVISIPFLKIQQVNFKRNLLQRLIGVYSVMIDTAGSNDKEVEIRALSREKAERLGELLMVLAEKVNPDSEPIEGEVTQEAPEETTSVKWEYKLEIPTLLKLGLTSNYFRGLAILMAFFFSLKEQFQFSDDLMEMPNLFLMELASQVIIVLALIVLGMLLTLGETFIKYYNLQVSRNSSGLQVEMGLRENTRVNIRPRRVQFMQVLTNPLQRKLDLFKLKISLASNQEHNEKDKIRIPGLPLRVVTKIIASVYSEEPEGEYQIRPDRIGLYRRIYVGFVPLGVGFAVILLGSLAFDVEWTVGLGLVYLLLMILYQIYYFRTVRLSVSDEFLIKHSGLWIRKKQILESYKLQSVSVSQPLWYKSRRLVNLTFHTAAGDMSFNFVDQSEAEFLRDYLLYKIEVTSEPWM